MVKIIITLLALTLVSCSESEEDKESRTELFKIITPESSYKVDLFKGPVIREGVFGKAMHDCLAKGKKLFNIGSYKDELFYELSFDDGYVIVLTVHNGVVFKYEVLKKDELVYRIVVVTSSADCPMTLLN